MAVPSSEELGIPSNEENDAYTLQQELAYLIGKAQEYNDRDDIDPRNRIPLDDIRTDKLKLIFSLWQRAIQIPEHLNITYGEPYDEVFSRWADGAAMTMDNDNYDESLFRPVTLITPYILLNHPENLLGYLLAAIDIRSPRIDKFNLKVLRVLKFPEIKTMKDLITVLSLAKPLDLVYLALEIENYRVTKLDVDINNYIDYYKDK